MIKKSQKIKIIFSMYHNGENDLRSKKFRMSILDSIWLGLAIGSDSIDVN